MSSRYLIAVFTVLLISACETYNPLRDYEPRTPATLQQLQTVSAGYPEEAVEKGKYLVQLLSCGTCHTDGALVGNPDPKRQFAGSRTGIAYSNPFENPNPGILYPANITPDIQTGIGSWSDEALVTLLKSGVDKSGRRHLPVMPWPAYRKLTDDDARAIAAFLKSMPAVRHAVPNNVPTGTPAREPYIHFGVYQRRP